MTPCFARRGQGFESPRIHHVNTINGSSDFATPKTPQKQMLTPKVVQERLGHYDLFQKWCQSL